MAVKKVCPSLPTIHKLKENSAKYLKIKNELVQRNVENWELESKSQTIFFGNCKYYYQLAQRR
jgi:hypothetical protein